MGRVPLIDPATTPAAAPLAERIRAQRGGRLLNLYATLLHSPAFAEGWLGLLTAVRQHGSLPPSIRELIILRVAQLNGASYEFAVHQPLALQAGVTQMQVDELQAWAGSRAFAERERAVLQLTDTMTRCVQVGDAVFQPLHAWFSDQQLVELGVTVAAYNMVSRFLEAMQVDHDDDPAVIDKGP
jgi:AhpD family alkylhydroperoxidase